MEMSGNYMPELHVAQQRRRDKLRVQQLEDFNGNNFHHHQGPSSSTALNHNSDMVFRSDMLNFTASQQGTFANIHPSRFVAPSSSDSCEPQPLQSCGNWVSTYDDQTHGRRNLVMSQFSVHNNPAAGAEISIAQHYQNNVHGWDQNGGNELPLLPSFLGQSNDASAHAQNHGLSLSLSSNQLSEMHRLGEPRELKPLELGSISPVVKLDCVNSNSTVQDEVGSSIQMYRNVGPLGPFTGYATILKSSKFLRPAQLLLDEFFSAAGVRLIRGCEEVESIPTSRGSNHGADCSTALVSKFHGSNDLSSGSASCESFRPDCHEKKAKLLHMQEEVCKRHKQYHQQMQMVISAFESVPGLSNATPYISRSLKTISRHFKSVKNAIADQLKLIRRALGEDLSSPSSFLKADSTNSRFDHNLAKVRSGAAGGMGCGSHQNHVWRPQRGLPERAVSILRAWLFDHFLHPYPTDTDKQMLANQTGLSRNQVSNWFINARVRLWKPMVEEIHMLETKGISRSETNINNSGLSITNNNRQASGRQPAVNAICDSKQLECLGSSSCMEESRNETSTEQLFQKYSRMESHQIPTSMDSSFIDFLPYQRRGIELGGLGAVSLTLGLRQGSETSQQQLQHQFQHQGMHFGGHVMHDFSG